MNEFQQEWADQLPMPEVYDGPTTPGTMDWTGL